MKIRKIITPGNAVALIVTTPIQIGKNKTETQVVVVGEGVDLNELFTAMTYQNTINYFFKPGKAKLRSTFYLISLSDSINFAYNPILS